MVNVCMYVCVLLSSFSLFLYAQYNSRNCIITVCAYIQRDSVFYICIYMSMLNDAFKNHMVLYSVCCRPTLSSFCLVIFFGLVANLNKLLPWCRGALAIEIGLML